jgi:class 3 adenylate cyclase
MTRARRIDIAVVALLAPVWLLCVFLHGRLLWSERLAWVPIHVTPSAAGFPAVSDLWPNETPAAVGLAPGDRLLAIGERELRGVGRLRLLSLLYGSADESLAVPLRIERGGREQAATLQLRRIAFPWRTLPLVVGLGVMGLLLPLRGSGARAARAWALAGVSYSLHWSLLFGPPAWQTYLGMPLFLGGASVFPPLLLRACLLTPDPAVPRGRIATGWTWALAVNGFGTSSWALGVPFSGEIGLRVIFAVNFVLALGAVAILARNYRRADAIGRRQVKWVLFGVYIGAAPVIFAAALGAIDPGFWWLYEISLVATAFTPFCIFIAFVRFGFLDIDRLLTVTAAYSLLSVVVLSVLFSVVPLLAELLSQNIGIEQRTVQTMMSVAVAAVLVPSERYVRPPLERLFFRERKALEAGASALRSELARVAEPGALFQTLGTRLAEFLRLETCVIYGLAGEAYAPLFARGAGVPPGFEAEGRLVSLLAEHAAPIPVAQWRRWARRGAIEGADRAALESLAPDVLLPIHREDQLTAFLCLGQKQSGDIFTQTDLTLLAGLVDRASLALLRFDAGSIERSERELNQALRSYVPAAVADELARGAAPAPGEREVTVLFVDVRGYTSFSQGRRPEEIFEVVNTYTTAVSGVIRRHSGAVVEFHGDGLMAVFGAPRTLEDKERAAVAAARDILGTVAGLELGRKHGLPSLEVGVGIATGDAFVGDIQAVDRRIWGVIGNTTNLAARLQNLTKDLEAAIVIDLVTGERASAEVHDFTQHEDIRVRGRSDAMQVYALPRTAPVAEAA